ncbi:MAG: preprotein translocase subunit SecE [Christensenellaceae bacterium]|jgi:preprotein translocase subunit SecE|nr:preprotein translocase subunit SecE [Christensenellaceae bacterium]
MSEQADKKAIKAKDDKAKKPAVAAKKPRFDLVKKSRELFAELKKVTWPSRRDLIRHSIVVSVFVVAVTVVVALYDLVFSSLMRLLI